MGVGEGSAQGIDLVETAELVPLPKWRQQCGEHGGWSGVWNLCRPLPVGQNWKDSWLPRKIEDEGWVNDWSMEEMTGFHDEPVMGHLTVFENTLPKGSPASRGPSA